MNRLLTKAGYVLLPMCVALSGVMFLLLFPAMPAMSRATLAQIPLFTDSGQAFEPSNTMDVALGDLNGDGYPDAIVTYAVVNEDEAEIPGEPNRVFLNDGEGNLLDSGQTLGHFDSRGVALGDLDGDGDLDAFVANANIQDSGTEIGEANKVWLNDGQGIFTDSGQDLGSKGSTNVALGDLDGDGDLDAFVTNIGLGDDAGNKVWLNNGTGYFTDTAQLLGQSLSSAVALEDLNQDGHLDAFVTNSQLCGEVLGQWICAGVQSNHVWINIGGGQFIDSGQRLGNADSQGVALGDLDADGDVDAFVSNGNMNDASGEANQVWLNDGTGQFNPSQALGESFSFDVGLGDLDGDGDLDAFVANSEPNNEDDTTGMPNRVWLNDGTALFTDSGQTVGESNDTTVALADLDGDSDLDAFAATTAADQVWLNESGPFSDNYQEIANNVSNLAALGDVDGDGDLDALLGVITPSYGTQVRLNDGTGHFTNGLFISGLYPHSIALGDLDSDNDLDLFASYPNHLPNQVWLNDGTGHFSQSGQSLGNADSERVVLGDLDADGDLDAWVSNEESHTVWLNNGQAQFTESGQELPNPNTDSKDVALGDLDDDGDLDIVVANESGSNQIWLNNGKGEFEASQELGNSRSYGVALGDLDGDGDLDCFVANHFVVNRVWLNDGTGHFTSSSQSFGNSESRDVALGDLDGDGDLDALVVNSDQANNVWLNDGDGAFKLSQSIGYGHTVGGRLGDLNQDGALDAWISNFGGEENHWLYFGKAGGRTRFKVSVQKPGPTADANFYSTPVFLSDATIPITYTLFDPAGATMGKAEGFYSFDGGDNWHPAVATSDTILTNLATSPHPTVTLTNTHLFVWDTYASGFFGQSNNVVFRLVAHSQPQATATPGSYHYPNTVAGAYEWPIASATTFPFRVRGAQIRVLSGTVPVEGAVIYRQPNGQGTPAALISSEAGQAFRTDPQGYLRGRGVLALGDKLVAMLPISDSEKLTVYHTNAAPMPNGLQMHTINSTGVQTLTVSAQKPLLLFDLDVSLEWDARNDEIFMDDLEHNLGRTSQILFDISNGQVALRKIQVYHAKEKWRESDVRVVTSNKVRPSATLGGVVQEAVGDILVNGQVITDAYLPGQIYMSASWNRYGNPAGGVGEDWPRTLAHELGHYLLFVPDNYLGLSENGMLIKIDCQGSVMTDPYREDYSEFLTREQWTGPCLDSLAQHTTGRTDWETIGTFYPMLQRNGGNPGPNNLPLAVTQVTVVEPAEPPTTLVEPIFNITDEDDASLFLPFGQAEGYLFKNQGSPEPNDDLVIPVGVPIDDRLRVRGAEPGDRLCLFDYSQSPRRLGCVDQLSDQPTNLSLLEVAGWQPEIIITSQSSRTLAITVTQALWPSSELYLQILPSIQPTTTNNIAPVATMIPLPNSNLFTQTITLDYPIANGFVRLWTNQPPLREEISPFFISGGWGPSTYGDGWDTNRQPYSWQAPIRSGDGQVTIFNLDQILGGNPLYTLQSLSTVPNLPSWLTPVGQAYRFSAAAPLTGTLNIMFEYMQRELPDDDEEEDLEIYYSPDEGQSWQRLNTALDTYRNLASSQLPGEGIYVLISTIKVRFYNAGWNDLSYSVNESRPITIALASIDGYYTSVHRRDGSQSPPQWLLYDATVSQSHPEFSGLVNDLTPLENRKVYWIYATEPITLYLGVGNSNSGQQALANSSISPPATYYGWVTPTDTFTPTVGMAVTAMVDGELCGETTIIELAGELAYKLQATDSGLCDVDNMVFQVGDWVMPGEVAWDNSQAWYHPLPNMPQSELHSCVTLQGRPAPPDLRWNAQLNLTLTAPGESQPTYNLSPTTDEDGCFRLAELEPGSYLARLKKNTTLQNVLTVTLEAGNNQIEFGTLREGDANNDNFVTILDFSILAAAFATCQADVGYDERADFNGDNCITILDFSLLASNFGQAGQDAPTEGRQLVRTSTTSTTQVTLALEPTALSVAPNDTFTVSLQLQTGNQPIDGGQIKLNFDPTLLEVQHLITKEANKPHPLPLQLLNQFDNSKGTIQFAAGTLDNHPKGTLELLQLQFKALAVTEGTTLTFSPDDTNVTFAGSALPSEQTNSTITISQPTALTMQHMQNPTPSPLWALLPLALTLLAGVRIAWKKKA